METMNVSFDELSAMAFEQRSLKPGLQSMTSGQISLELGLIYASSTITKQQPTEGELDLLFKVMYDDYFGGQPSATVENVPPAQEPQDVDELNPNAMIDAMYDDYFGGQPSATARTVPPVQEPQVHRMSTASTTIADTAPIPTNSSSHAKNTPITSQDVNKLNPNAMVDGNTFVNPFANSSTSAAASSSSQKVDPSNMHTFYQPYPHEFQWTKDHPLERSTSKNPIVFRKY
uniref:Integrase, catalytic region, zinc finger, CCHC-type, peptidase aspartic, catalytic n=1 Tax=Tanacetum cinerariifolium TaxID=118510 RepID=A0A699Q273_TANCI|nr:hypothetical protein [Tanacetum cinerariifolium]